MSKQEIFDKFIEIMGEFAQIRAVAALRDGFIMTTPFTICGSVFLLLANLPVPGYADFMASIFGTDWTAPQVARSVCWHSSSYCPSPTSSSRMKAAMP